MAKKKLGWGDAFRATMRNLGDPEAARREIAVQQDRRKTLLSWQGDLEAYARAKQQEAVDRVKRERSEGNNVRDVVIFHATILSGFDAIVKVFESGDPNRVDIYYGGSPEPDGEGHGHIIIRHGQVDTWFAHGAEKKDRIQIV